MHHPSTLVHWWVLLHSGHTGSRRRRRRRAAAPPSYSSDHTSTDVVLLVQCELTLEIRFRVRRAGAYSAYCSFDRVKKKQHRKVIPFFFLKHFHLVVCFSRVFFFFLGLHAASLIE